MNIPRNIIIHHSLVSYDKNPRQFTAIDNYHKSKGWGQCGYHYVIEKDGTIVQGRQENQVGAHCYQKWMNYRSIGICLSGNFDHELPTVAQLVSLKTKIEQLRNRYNISPDHVFGHRDFATYKSCPGTLFTDNMIREVATGIVHDLEFAKKYEGRVLIDTEDKGRKWYVFDGRRYEIDKAPKFEKTIQKNPQLAVWMKHYHIEKIPK